MAKYLIAVAWGAVVLAFQPLMFSAHAFTVQPGQLTPTASPNTRRAFLTSPRSAATTSVDSVAGDATGASIAPPIQIPPVDHPLIVLANDIIYTKSGFYSPADPSVYSSEFVFRGPYIGPLNKKDYLHTMNTFKIHEAFPDISPNAFGWSIDPKNPNKLWFMVRNTGTFTGEPGLGLGNGQFFPPNGKKVEGCPETFSITFDSEKKVKHLTVGYVADRFEGNVSGKGAAVGIMNAIGFPFPGPGPLLKFAQWFGTEVAKGGPLSYSTEDIPAWWTSEEKASEGYS